MTKNRYDDHSVLKLWSLKIEHYLLVFGYFEPTPKNTVEWCHDLFLKRDGSFGLTIVFLHWQTSVPGRRTCALMVPCGLFPFVMWPYQLFAICIENIFCLYANTSSKLVTISDLLSTLQLCCSSFSRVCYSTVLTLQLTLKAFCNIINSPVLMIVKDTI